MHKTDLPLPAGVKWLFLDLNSYFASVEQQERPELRGRPVAVVPMMADATCAIAASYEAKAYGIKTGTKIYEAKKKCPGLVCVLARHDIYTLYHHKILDEVIKHTPINQVWSIDELSSRLPPNKRTIEAACDVAHKLKQGLRDNIGEAVKCSIGLAPNGFLAKVATDMEKPDGLVVLTAENLKERLFQLELRDLPGINVNMEARLHRAGITSIEALWNISPKHARKIWGGVGGERFWYNLHGAEVPDQETSRVMIGHSRILDPELKSPEMAHRVARRLTSKSAARLRHQEFWGRSFDLGVRTIDGERWAGSSRFQAAHDNFTFLAELDKLWARMLVELKPRRLLKVSVVISSLCAGNEVTPDLFAQVSEQAKITNKRNESLSAAIDYLNKKHGAETLTIGVSPKTRAGHLGTKIAFSRIPDLSEFNQ